MNNFTPGPWKVIPPDKDSKRWFISCGLGADHESKFYVAILGTKESTESGRDKADAQLIAAAPELLAALEYIHTNIDVVLGGNVVSADERDFLHALNHRAKSAIKAIQ